MVWWKRAAIYLFSILVEMKTKISPFIKRTLLFIVPLVLLPLAVFITDPFDYLDYQPKLKLDRIHTVRRINVADWTLSEVKKIDTATKSKVTVVSIGDSRGRLLMSGGYEKGWQGRINGANQNRYDLSFGGAQLDESISLLNMELKYLDALDTILIVLPIDRILTYKQHINRIETSQFNSKKSTLNYLTNYKQLSYLFYENIKGGYTVKDSSEQEKVRTLFLSSYNTTSRKTFDKNLLDLMRAVTKLKSSYEVKIILTPYDNRLLKEIRQHHQEDYNYFLLSLKSSMLKESVQVNNLQDLANRFTFVDPVHGILKNESIYDILNAHPILQ